MSDAVSLLGRTVVVTGAGQGIGKAMTELAIQLGVNVVAHAGSHHPASYITGQHLAVNGGFHISL